MATGYEKILQQQREMQKEVGKVHTHLMAHSRVTSAILPAILFGGGMVALCSGMYRLYTGAHRRRTLLQSVHAQNIGLSFTPLPLTRAGARAGTGKRDM